MKQQQSGFSTVELVLVLAVVAVIAGIGFVVIGKNNKTNKAGSKKTTTAQTKVAAPTNAGSCFGVSKATIKTLLGPPADNLQDLSDTGTVDVGKGDKARTCVYPFAAGATATNSFTIDLGTYASQANLDNSQKYLPSAGAAVSGLGESASYAAADASISKSRDFVLTIRQDLKIYKFGISQPEAAVTYNDASAQRVLIQIAQAATL